MKKIILLLILILINLPKTIFGQTDTIIAYNISTQTTSIIPPVSFDTTITFEQTPFSLGTMANQTPLMLTAPTTNLFSGSNFSDIEPADQFFNITDYPIRTATRLFLYNSDTLGGCCSGILVGKNLVLTAAHCVRSYAGYWYGDSSFVAPAFNNGLLQAGFQNSTVKNYYIFKSYFDGNILQDYALLELNQPIGEQIGWLGMAFNIDTTFYSNNVFHKLSYPGVISPFDPTKIYNGDTLYYNYGNINNIGNNLGINSIDAKAIPGQSGSSFFYTDNFNFYSVGVLIWSSNYMHYKITNNIFYQFKNIIDNYTTGIQKNESDNNWLSVYPNPTTNSITIKSKNSISEKFNLTLTDVIGNIIFSQDIEFQNQYKLNLEEYANGIYFLTLKNSIKQMTQKIVIQK